MLHRAPISRWLGTALRISERPAHVELPIFLCPSVRCAVASTPRGARRLPWRPHLQQQQQQQQRRRMHAQASASASVSPGEDNAAAAAAAAAAEPIIPIEKLPKQCTGCGALSQLSFPDQPGYYDLSRKAVRKYLGMEEDDRRPRSTTREEDRVAEEALKSFLEKGVDLDALGLSLPPAEEPRRMCIQPPPPYVT